MIDQARALNDPLAEMLYHASDPKPIPPGDLRPAPSTAEATPLPDGVSTWEFLWGSWRDEREAAA